MILATLLLTCLPQIAAETAPLPACIEGFFQGAQNKDEAGLSKLLAPDRHPGELETLYQLLTQVPFRYECIEGNLWNRDRSLVCMKVRSQLDQEGSEFWFWLVGTGAETRLLGVLGDARYSREWLYQTPKDGTSPSPLEAAKVLFQAMQAGDSRGAQQASSDLAWRKDGGDLESLFQTAHTTGLGFATEAPKVLGDRAVVGFGFEFNGQRQGSANLYVEKRGAGWIATGFDDSPDHAQAFLRGEIAATVWPKSPFDAYEHFVAALGQRQTIRLSMLSDETYGETPEFAQAWLPPAVPRLKVTAVSSSVRFQEGKGLGRVDFVGKSGKPARSLYCLLKSTPNGWRVVGHTEDETLAENYLIAVTPPTGDSQ